MIRRLVKALMLREIRATLVNYKILSIGFGQLKSMRRWQCIDGKDAPIPWYTYPAIEFIKQLDFSDKAIFEYGSGNSTRFWAQRCRKLVSVEDNRDWYEKIKIALPDHVEYLLHQGTDYIQSINNCEGNFDVIVIDGNYRYDCAVQALGKLRDDGFIVLDNSDWTERTSELLRSSDLIEVDMSGFGPINGYTWTTSFYFRRNVHLRSAQDRQPVHGIGSLKQSETQAGN